MPKHNCETPRCETVIYHHQPLCRACHIAVRHGRTPGSGWQMRRRDAEARDGLPPIPPAPRHAKGKR
jgi:hypothetical protein